MVVKSYKGLMSDEDDPDDEEEQIIVDLNTYTKLKNQRDIC